VDITGLSVWYKVADLLTLRLPTLTF